MTGIWDLCLLCFFFQWWLSLLLRAFCGLMAKKFWNSPESRHNAVFAFNEFAKTNYGYFSDDFFPSFLKDLRRLKNIVMKVDHVRSMGMNV